MERASLHQAKKCPSLVNLKEALISGHCSPMGCCFTILKEWVYISLRFALLYPCIVSQENTRGIIQFLTAIQKHSLMTSFSHFSFDLQVKTSNASTLFSCWEEDLIICVELTRIHLCSIQYLGQKRTVDLAVLSSTAIPIWTCRCYQSTNNIKGLTFCHPVTIRSKDKLCVN